MVQIKKQLISDTAYKFGKNNKKKYITIHETGNTGKGTGAQVHANLQTNGNARAASWHWQVDDKEAIQSYDHSFQLWHGGDGSGGDGNLNSIAIEICVNSDGDYVKAIRNAAMLTKRIMEEEGISVSNVVQHNRWSGKNCPTYLRSGSKGIDWNGFLALVKKDVLEIEGDYSGKQIRVTYKGDDGVNIRKTADWDTEPYAAYSEGTTKDIIGKVSVDGSEMYRISDGSEYYITAHSDFVEVIDKPVIQAKVVDETKYRLMTGLFDDADRYAKALEDLKEDYGWLLHENTNKAGYNPRYRIITGTFTGKEKAEKYAEEIRKKFGWKVYVKEAK